MKNAVKGVQPEIIRWARESIGLTTADVAQKLKKSIEEIEAWEKGTQAPSYPQLEKLAYQVYKRPLAVFFLPEPPVEKNPKLEFRTLPESDMEELAPDTYLQIRKTHAYQLALEDIFSQVNPATEKIWQSVHLSLNKNISVQADLIRKKLGVSIENQSQWKSSEFALKYFRAAIEEKGVFIFKSAFKQKDISGYCLVSKEFPLISLNNSTTKTRQLFSLLHELSHLLLNMNGLSKFDASYIEHLPESVKKIEQFCNAIAAEILIPTEDFKQNSLHLPYNIENAGDNEIEMLADRYSVSREVILRRFLDQNRIGIDFYREKAKFWTSQKKTGSHGNWYATTNVYLSERFAKEVVSQYYRHKITVEQAADYLGIKAKNFAGLEDRILKGVRV